MNGAADVSVEIAARHAVYLEKYKTHAFKEYEPFLRRVSKLIKQRLSGFDEWTRTEMEKQLRSISKDIKLIQLEYVDDLSKSTLTLAEYEAGFEARSLSEVVKYDFDLPSEAQLKSAVFTNPLTVKGVEGGKLLTPFFKDMPARMIDTVTNHVRTGFYEGLTTQQVINSIIGTKGLKYSDGKLSDLYKTTELVTRTGLQHASAQAREEVWKKNDDLITGVEWVSTLDFRTSSTCRDLDGNVYPKTDAHPVPPAHINCRSTLVAVLDKRFDVFDKHATRKSKGAEGVKSVSAKTSYYDWLKTQPAKFQDDVLGITRGKLFRDGGLSIKRFKALQLDRNFKPMSLEKMRAKEPNAFAKIEKDN